MFPNYEWNLIHSYWNEQTFYDTRLVFRDTIQAAGMNEVTLESENWIRIIISNGGKISCFLKKHFSIIFIHLYSASLSMSHSEALPTTALKLCRSLHAAALRASASEGLTQGPYIVVRVGFEPVTFWTEGTKHHQWAIQILCSDHLTSTLCGYNNIFVLTYNLTHCRMFRSTGKVWMGGSRLLQESNLAARQPLRCHITLYRQLWVEDLPKVPT